MARVFRNIRDLVQNYEFREFDGDLLYFLTGKDKPKGWTATERWKQHVTGNVTKIWLPVAHSSLFEPETLHAIWSGTSAWLADKAWSGGTRPSGVSQDAGLGAVQQTLFIPLAARARETRKKRAVLRDPKAAEIVASVDFDTAKYGRGWRGFMTVPQTAIFDSWVSGFLAEHPAGTIIEIGTGLNSRFERVDNGRAHWIDLDLPDAIELRRQFFAHSVRRRVVAASVLEEDWLAIVEDSPGPYFFVADGVLAYLAQAPQVITRIAGRFPGALLAFDTYSRRALEQQHRLAAKKNVDARWAWSCDDPRSLESSGLEVVEAVAVTRPPHGLRMQWPLRYRFLLSLADQIVGDIATVTLFQSRASSSQLK